MIERLKEEVRARAEENRVLKKIIEGLAELLAKKGVVAVLYGKALSHFAADMLSEFDIPAFFIDEIPLLSEGVVEGGSGAERDFEVINGHILNEKIEEWRRKKINRKRVILQR